VSTKGTASIRSAVALWLRLARIYNHNVRVTSEHLREWNLSPAQFDVLAQVGSAEGLTQVELADRLLVTQGNITQLLDKMEQSGLLERRREGRIKRLSLTETGRALYNQVVPAQEELQQRQFSALSAEEQRQLLSLLRKVDHAQR
jgi:DNA-binding MarR family transcriptional regulator